MAAELVGFPSVSTGPIELGRASELGESISRIKPGRDWPSAGLRRSVLNLGQVDWAVPPVRQADRMGV